MRNSMIRFCRWVSQPAKQTTRKLNLGKITARFALLAIPVQLEMTGLQGR